MRASIVASSLLALTQAFYIPGFSYKSYRDGDTIPLLVNKVYSDYSELQYAFTELPFVCPPTGRLRAGHLTSGTSITLNLGEVLRGDRIVVSDYELVMGVDEEVRYLCSQTIDLEGIRRANELIRDGYVAEWIVDNLPGATSFQTTDKSRKYYAAGFKLGDETRLGLGGPAEYLLNNHVTLVIRYHRAPGKDGDKGKKVIVGFEVFPRSITANDRDESGFPAHIEGEHEPLLLVPQANSTNSTDTENEPTTLTIPYTYSVYWREDDRLEWQNRWDMYFVAQDDSANVHWLAIVNSLVICGLLTAVLSVVLTRTIRSDISGHRDIGLAGIKSKSSRKTSSPKREKSNLLGPVADLDIDNMVSDEEEIEDTAGWKLLHGDVFRAPAYGGLLAPLVGSGMQLLYMAFGLIVLSTLGVLNPSFRGGYISVGVGLFVFAGVFSGYFSARIYKTFGGQTWQKNVIITASLVPGLLFATIFILNLFVWIQASSTALPFGTLIALIMLWFFVQLPLVYVGSWFGFERMGAYTHPIRANIIPRQIPDQRWYFKSGQKLLLAGLFPFMVIFVELMFVVKSLWVDKTTYYYAFGYAGVVSAVLTITVVEFTIAATYFLLCSENYHWWWHSFATGGASSIWVYAYLIYCYFTKLHISGFVSSMLFFAYGFLACAVYGLLTGTIGFLAAYAFVGRIYGAIKVD
ncbi:endomembrane protein 70 [Macroventuria anomochaeta]|uniref:Endomembrane protein 70 n=1 Tax=Macroventuria anomochaeta TaxID=301207 RepID=A0ACB6S0Z4_9PLEO|nr:endomembrane protein 70 [Macroventuria anomochaeta]KAF2627709.1 endomembrane protein 70 [Macroventuria anomochaeta]